MDNEMQFAEAVDDKIIDRIKKLLALAEANPNEHEANIAMERAHRLLAKYNLDIADLPKERLDKDDPYVRFDERYGLRKGCVAGRRIAAGIAKLYFCKMFYVHVRGGFDIYSFVGRKTNVDVASSVSNHVVNTLYALAMAPRDASYATNFMIGAAQRISRRVQELIDQAEAGKLKEEDAGQKEVKNLPALRATYQAEAERTEQFIQEALKLKIRNTGSSWRGGRGEGGQKGFHEGRAAGDRVSLRPELGTAKRKALENA